MSAQPSSALHHGGSAAFDLRCSPDGRTYIGRQRVTYPFHVTRPFYFDHDPEGMLSLYLQSVSGGIFADDVLDIRLSADQGAHAHVTTQSSTVVHRMDGERASQRASLRAACGALIEYMPDPVVMFPGATLETHLEIACAHDATVIACDGFLAHDSTGASQPFGEYRSTLTVAQPDKPAEVIDRFELDGQTFASDSRFKAHGAMAVVTSHPRCATMLPSLHQLLEDEPMCYAGVSTLPSSRGLWIRVLAEDSRALRLALGNAWRAVRLALTGREARARPK